MANGWEAILNVITGGECVITGSTCCNHEERCAPRLVGCSTLLCCRSPQWVYAEFAHDQSWLSRNFANKMKSFAKNCAPIVTFPFLQSAFERQLKDYPLVLLETRKTKSWAPWLLFSTFVQVCIHTWNKLPPLQIQQNSFIHLDRLLLHALDRPPNMHHSKQNALPLHLRRQGQSSPHQLIMISCTSYYAHICVGRIIFYGCWCSCYSCTIIPEIEFYAFF